MAPVERLPDYAPFPLFFLPNFLGILFALCMEHFSVEETLLRLIHEKAHRYSLLGLGIFAMCNVNSFLGGSVVLARIEYGVKLPNLYANTKEGRDEKAVLFNCIQRGHQNFLEVYAQVVLTVLFTADVANRPNVAGLLLLIIAGARISYALGYKSNIVGRTAGQMLAIFTMSTGVGYAFLVGATAVGLELLS